MPDTGSGATIAFATTGFTASYTAIGGAEITRPAVKTSHLTTLSSETYIPGDLVDNGEQDCELQYNPNSRPPIGNATETVTITYPVPSGQGNGATKSGSAFLTKWTEPECKNNELMMAQLTLHWAGNVTYTNSS